MSKITEAVETFLSAYRARYRNDGKGGMRANAPMLAEVTALNSAFIASREAAVPHAPAPDAVQAAVAAERWLPIETAPKDGTRILFGGRWRAYSILPGGSWETIIVSWTTVQSNGKGYQWLTQEFARPSHWNVDWTDWASLPEPPARTAAPQPTGSGT